MRGVLVAVVVLAVPVAVPVAGPVAGQERVAVPVGDILACAEALNCRNMKRSALNWYDQVNIPVVTFSEDGQSFALRRGRDGLSVWLSLKGESRPSRLLTIGDDGRVVSAEQFVAHTGRWPRQLTREESAKRNQDTRALLPARPPRRDAIGEEFRPFWQTEADRALAAIRRQVARN
jgi:hypothetical protein